MTIEFKDQVAIVTGAGQGLGRSYALALAKRGAKVVVNDVGAALDGTSLSATAGSAVVREIEAAGGEAVLHPADVSKIDQVEAMVKDVMERWGRIDILVNNAGILRDKSFAKINWVDFDAVFAVHYKGTVHCIKAVWDIMREQNYGRIIVTTSCAGLYGNFGQSSYSSAKMAVIGLMNTLTKEATKHDIRVNAICPSATTRMTESLLTDEQRERMSPDSVAVGVCFLASPGAPNRTILTSGGGSFATAQLVETKAVHLSGDKLKPEEVAARWSEISALGGSQKLESCEDQTNRFMIVE